MRVPAWITDGRYFRVPSLTLAAVILGVSVAGMHLDEFRGTGIYDLRALALTLVRVDDPVLLVVVIAATLLLCGWAERVMGARRMLFAYVGGGLLTSAIGLLVGELEEHLLAAVPLNSEPTDGANPVAALLVVAMAASCFTGALWRRRIRLLAGLIAVTLFLYAASANDLYALVALPVGVAVGMLAGGTRAAPGVQRSSQHETRVLLTALTTVVAVGPIIATVWGSGAGLLSAYGWLSYDPLVLADGTVCVPGSFAIPCPEGAAYDELQPHAGWIAVLPLTILLVAAGGILRGRRSALWIAIGMNILLSGGMTYVFIASEPDTLALFAEVQGVDSAFVWQTLVGLVVGAMVPLGVALTLVLCRRAVPVRSLGSAEVTFVVTIVVAAAGVSLAAFMGSLALSGDFMPRPSVGEIAAELPLRLLPPSLIPAAAVTSVPESTAAQVLWYLPSLLFWTACVWATFRLVVSPQAVRGAEDRARASEMVRRGCSSLGFMATWPGNLYWFAADADAALAYRVHGRVAVTLGGAFGSERNRPDIGSAFVEFCGRNGWTPVFYSVDESFAEALAPLRWQRVRVADEAIIDPQTWTPAGKKRQDVRTATNRAQREGVRAQWTTWNELSIVDRLQIRDISEAWVADKTIPEMGFTLGTVDDATDPATRFLLARDATGHIVAVTTWIPIFGNGGTSGYALDVMRRRHDAMNGVMEFLIGSAVDVTREEGCTILSLSGSPLAPHRDQQTTSLPALDRLLEMLSGLLEPAYGFRSLANFKKKFQPDFAPLWMVYPDAVSLPGIGLALLRCYVPGLSLTHAARLAARARTSST
jgi:phosphatidylglycerol lysyltransferase